MGISFWKTVIFFILIGAFAVLLFPSYRELGMLYTRTNIFGKAQRYLLQQFRRYPEDTANTIRYLYTLLHSQKNEEFTETAAQMIAMYPEKIEFYMILAEFYEDRMMFAEASGCWIQMLELNPNLPDTEEKFISYCRLFKDTDALISFYQWKIDKGIAKHEEFSALAGLFASRKEPRRTAEVLLKAQNTFMLELSEELLLAQAYEAEPDLAKALQLYAKVYSENPLDKDFALFLAEKYLSYKNYPQAKKFFAELIRRFDDEKFQDTLLSVYEKYGRLEDNLLVMEEFYRENPANFKLLKRLSIIYMDLYDYDKALLALRSYNEKTGGDYHTYHLLGDILTSLGDKAAGQREYQQALRLIRAQGKRL